VSAEPPAIGRITEDALRDFADLLDGDAQ